MVSAAHADTSPCPEGSFPVGSPPPDGYEQKCVLPDGKMQGLWRVWYPNGQLMSETPMDKGREHGELRAWWPNGQLMMRGQSIYGNRYRQFEYWDMSGHVQSVDTEAVETVIPAEGAPSAIRKVVEE
ncbi:MAG TPA: hypothetical protein VIM96_05830 [Pseudomonadales bacterium]